MFSAILYAVLLIAAMVPAAIGYDFSPSFTALFVLLFQAGTALGEVLLLFRDHKHGKACGFFGLLLPILGAVWAIPAVYIYGFGIDHLDGFLNAGMASAVILHLLLWQMMGVLAGFENFLLLASGLFTVISAVSCPALWPFGVGILLIFAAQRLDDAMEATMCRRVLVVLGLCLCAVFPLAPMLFNGRA